MDLAPLTLVNGARSIGIGPQIITCSLTAAICKYRTLHSKCVGRSRGCYSRGRRAIGGVPVYPSGVVVPWIWYHHHTLRQYRASHSARRNTPCDTTAEPLLDRGKPRPVVVSYARSVLGIA
eukprot:1807093-Rhodomonas_salina.3